MVIMLCAKTVGPSVTTLYCRRYCDDSATAEIRGTAPPPRNNIIVDWAHINILYNIVCMSKSY